MSSVEEVPDHNIRSAFARPTRKPEGIQEVVRIPACAGRPRVIDGLFLEAWIEQRRNILLEEPQDQLREVCGAEGSISTIWTTLHG
ncbi:hypothetical protein BD779DRAFT_1790200 [Infundibulicybe gibba]|nr:hypothetical protein BD779DRAFT_1790200 [Infundibulicybe gibba]